MARCGKKSLVYEYKRVLTTSGHFRLLFNRLVDCECGKKEREDFIALIVGDWVCLCAKVCLCPHRITQVVLEV